MSSDTTYPYVLFWELDVTPSSPISLSCFSQWFDRPFSEPETPSIVYKTAEHYMMYQKALLFDSEAAQPILDAPTPEEAKKRGRAIRNFDRAVWAREADGVVERGNYLKFGQIDDLREYLLQTGEKVMVECNPTDRIWGIGFTVEEARGREAEWGDNR